LSLRSTLRKFESVFDFFSSKKRREIDEGASGSRYGSMLFSPFRTTANQFTTKLYNQIAIDVASTTFRHIEQTDSGEYSKDIPSSLDKCFRFMANVDQTWSAFLRDVVWTLFENGHAAIVATDTTANPFYTEEFDVLSLRVGTVTQWNPRSVRISLYNDRTGQREEINIEKELVAIVNNPMFMVMNEATSDLRRLLRKLVLLDAIDEQSGSGKLDLIIQLPYSVSSERQMQRAERRRKSLERQMENSKYGVGWIDDTEKVTQLNRASENNLMAQVEWLTTQVYSALGISKEIFEGTATEQQMLVYQTRTLNPILREIATTMSYAFLGENARGRGQRIAWFRDPFELVPMSSMGDLVQALTSAEVMTSNEARAKLGFMRASDPRADKLVNANINSTSPPDVPKPTTEEVS
jgi:hypothetical protein